MSAMSEAVPIRGRQDRAENRAGVNEQQKRGRLAMSKSPHKPKVPPRPRRSFIPIIPTTTAANESCGDMHQSRSSPNIPVDLTTCVARRLVADESSCEQSTDSSQGESKSGRVRSILDKIETILADSQISEARPQRASSVGTNISHRRSASKSNDLSVWRLTDIDASYHSKNEADHDSFMFKGERIKTVNHYTDIIPQKPTTQLKSNPVVVEDGCHRLSLSQRSVSPSIPDRTESVPVLPSVFKEVYSEYDVVSEPCNIKDNLSEDDIAKFNVLEPMDSFAALANCSNDGTAWVDEVTKDEDDARSRTSVDEQEIKRNT